MASNNVIEQVRLINVECFTSDDPYSDFNYLQNLLHKPGAGLITVREFGFVIGYIIYYEYGRHIESLRRGVIKSRRGLGYGVKLSKKLTAIARYSGKEIYTYVAKTNLASLNSNLKVGYRIDNIGEDWVYIRYKP